MFLIFAKRFMENLKKLKSFILSKHFLKHFGMILLAYIVIVGGTILYLDFSTNHGQKIEVPSLCGKNVKNVQAMIEDLDLKYVVLDSIYAPDKPEGTILSQDPRPTDSTDVYVKEGRIISLRVSKKSRLVEVPNIVDRSERFAISVLKNRGLKYKISYKPSSESDGAVLDQKYKGRAIKEGIKIPIGSTIYLVVGKNKAGAPVEIPNLVGLTISEVKVRLSGMSINLFESYFDCATASDSLNARVISQSPEYLEGMTMPSNSTISIQLSTGGGVQNP